MEFPARTKPASQALLKGARIYERMEGIFVVVLESDSGD